MSNIESPDLEVPYYDYDEESQYPSLTEIEAMCSASGDFAELTKMLQDDAEISHNLHTEARQLASLRMKYVKLYGSLRYQACKAKDKMDAIQSTIVKGFYDNPKAFIPNTKNKNMQLATAVYKTHPQYRQAVREFYHYSTMVKMVESAGYSIGLKSKAVDALSEQADMD